MLSVCVVGAGAAGLSAARHLAAAGRSFQVFEQAARPGGTWLYNDYADGHSSMYCNLRTNFPMEIMSYMDYPYRKGGDSFVHHTVVLDYIEEFAREFDLYKHIKFNTRVEKVKPVHRDGGQTTWEVTTEDATNQHREMSEFDAVMVCSGHYTKPSMPHIPGMDSFEGIQIHSHNYRRPEAFAGLTVVVLGASFSGVDIAMDVHPHARQVLLSHRDPPAIDCEMPRTVKQIPVLRSATKDGFVTEDGSTWKADAIIFCTGYEYDFPFLDPSCHVTVDDGRVMPLYKHFIHIKMPSLVFIGLPSRTLPLAMADIQAQFFLKMLDGAVSLPTQEEMLADCETDFQERLSLGRSSRQAHQLGSLQWDYFEYLSRACGCPGVSPVTEKLYKHTARAMEDDYVNYRSSNYEIVDSENYAVVK